jgi:hypothetical protein
MADVVSLLGNGFCNWTNKDLVESGGTLRWHLALEKAYRRSQKKGWISKRSDGVWTVTEKGRAAALEEQGAT